MVQIFIVFRERESGFPTISLKSLIPFSLFAFGERLVSLKPR